MILVEFSCFSNQINGSGTCFYLLFSSVNKGFQQKSVLAFRFIFIIDFYKMKVPLLQTNLIVLERILVVSEIITKPDTWCIKTFKHLSHFLYLMRPIFVIISCCDKTESDKKNFSSCWELILLFFAIQRLATTNQQSRKWNRPIKLNNNKWNI